MSTINTDTKTNAVARVQALIAGTQKHFPNGQVTFGNTTYTTATVVQTLQGLADSLNEMYAAQTSANDAMIAQRAMAAKVAPFIRGYTSYLRATFDAATAQLGDFGLQPPKARTPIAADKRLAATAKLRATRAARGTLGKKQKLAIKGNVTGVIVTPITASPPTAAAPAATPAGVATGSTATGAPAPATAAPSAAPKSA